jgi:hypothetical protein
MIYVYIQYEIAKLIMCQTKCFDKKMMYVLYFDIDIRERLFTQIHSNILKYTLKYTQYI